MTSVDSGNRILEPVERLFAALVDPKRRERTMVGLLVGYAAVWTLYGALAKGSRDIHFDMGEMIAWSREVGLGTPKHPPLAAWLVKAWFSVFPLADWAYYLFAIAVATVALWVAWAISARYLNAEKRVAGLALLTFVPFFNFHALKFNANTVMMPLWAATTWVFLRSYETRSTGAAALAGIAAAAAMLGKYWSIVLLVGLGLAALADPRRGAYFRSAAPWVTIAVGALGLFPHIAWLYANDFTPFAYAMQSHPATIAQALQSGFGYIAGAIAYIATPVLIAVIAARPGRAAVSDTGWPREPEQRLVLLAFLLPLLLPVLAALVASERIVSLWSIGSMTLLPVALLSSPRVNVSRTAAKRILALALAVPLLALAASPVIAIAIHRLGVANFATHYRLVAQAVERTWRETTDRPLALVGSYDNLLYGMLFYFPERPSGFEIVSPYLTPWADEARIASEGIAFVCPTVQDVCIRALNERAARSPGAKRVEVEISRTHFGVADKPERYVIVAAPPMAVIPAGPRSGESGSP